MSNTTSSILLATDLSPRSDRALDRAVQIALARNARLVVLHVVEPSLVEPLANKPWHHNAPDPRTLAEQRLRRDLGGTPVQIDVVIAHGKAVDLIHTTAAQHHCELIVTGTARDETLGRVLLGTTVEKLVRISDIPVLVVKNRPHGNYGHAVLTTDFSEGSRAAIRAAFKLLPEVPYTLFHSYATPLGPTKEGATQAGARAITERDGTAFLANTPELAGKSLSDIVLAEGQPELAIARHVAEHEEVDLVVTGTHGRTGILRTALGSVADFMIERLPADLLVVRQPHTVKR